MACLRQVRAWSAALLLVSGTARAQGGATVPPSSDIYRRIEAVSAFFPAPVHLGLRPASQRALRQVVRGLQAAVDAAPHTHARRAWALEELRVLRVHLADSTRRARASVSSEVFASDARSARIDSNGLGAIDAVENVFARHREGLPTPSGVAWSTLPQAAVITPSVALLAEPSIVVVNAAGASRADVRVHRAYGRGVFRNIALEIGSDGRQWGQSPHGALFLSDHAAPFPAVALGTDTAITLPWLFRHVGSVRGELLVADLGPTQRPPHARLAGWQVNFQPWSRFELGVAVLAHTGGNGAPPATFLQRVVDLFPAIDALAPAHSDLQFSNKVAGGSLRLRFPELSGLDLYYELALDDFDARRLASSFADDAGHLLGARIAGGPVVWRAEWHRTSLRLYEHAQFRSGLTYRRHLIGSALGPHARAGYLGAEWDLGPRTRAQVTVADERRDPSQYTVTVSGTRDRGFRFIRMTDEPVIRRALLTGSLDHAVGVGALRVTAGYNRAWREGSPPRHEWLAQLSARTGWLPTF